MALIFNFHYAFYSYSLEMYFGLEFPQRRDQFCKKRNYSWKFLVFAFYLGVL